MLSGSDSVVPDVPDSAVDSGRRVAELETENRRLRQLLGIDGRLSVAPAWEPALFTEPAETAERKVNRRSPPEKKVELFRALFRGRGDVYALRWRTPEPAEVAGRQPSYAHQREERARSGRPTFGAERRYVCAPGPGAPLSSH